MPTKKAPRSRAIQVLRGPEGKWTVVERTARTKSTTVYESKVDAVSVARKKSGGTGVVIYSKEGVAMSPYNEKTTVSKAAIRGAVRAASVAKR